MSDVYLMKYCVQQTSALSVCLSVSVSVCLSHITYSNTCTHRRTYSRPLHKHIHVRTRARTHIHTRARARTHALTHSSHSFSLSLSLSHTHTHTHTHTHSVTNTNTISRTWYTLHLPNSKRKLQTNETMCHRSAPRRPHLPARKQGERVGRD